MCNYTELWKRAAIHGADQCKNSGWLELSMNCLCLSEDHCVTYLFFFCLSCPLRCGKPACPHHGVQKVIKDEATGAAECEPGGDRPGSSCHHVPSGRRLCLEPSLARGRCLLPLLRPRRILLRHRQHYEPHCPGHCALHCVPQSALSQ